jgi:hypothetical protein
MARRSLRKAKRLLTSPRFWQVFHALNIAKWLILFPIGMIWWRNNIAFLMYVSLDTALGASLAGYGSALGARKADPEDPL